MSKKGWQKESEEWQEKLFDENGNLRSVINCIFKRTSNGDKILMFKRCGEEWEHGYEPIKGAIHKQEREKEAAKRELKEESGLSIENNDVKMIGSLEGYLHGTRPHPVKKGKLNVRARVFVFEYTSLGDIRIGEEEHVGYRWMDIETAIKKNFLRESGQEMIEPAYNLFSKDKT